MTDPKAPVMSCKVCQQPFTDTEDGKMSQYAAFGGLPAQCCGHCFAANDYSVKSLTELQVKSLLRRASKGELIHG